MLESWDDDQLLAALGEAIRARQDVPDAFVEMGKGAYAWHHIDAELALLTYDSSRAEDRDVTASMRSETASIRALTFTSAHLSLELEVTGDSLLGQIIPPRPGTLDTQTRDGATASTDVDEIGCFAVTPIPASPFRLRCRTVDGTDVLTGWISLLGNEEKVVRAAVSCGPTPSIRCARAFRMSDWITSVTARYSVRDADPRPACEP